MVWALEQTLRGTPGAEKETEKEAREERRDHLSAETTSSALHTHIHTQSCSVIRRTLATFHLLMSPFHRPALWNVRYMLVTCPTSHFFRELVNACASWKRNAMFVTADVIHADMSALKSFAFVMQQVEQPPHESPFEFRLALKDRCMSCTDDVSHSLIGPHSTVPFPSPCSTHSYL